MRAVILAAGRGRRLGHDSIGQPKILLNFGGRTLLQRHVENLAESGITDITVVVGYRADLVREEIAALGHSSRIAVIDNPDYAEGSVVSLWSAAAVLDSGRPILLMDGDVLYDWKLMRRLAHSNVLNCLLLDRGLEPGDEPVKICIAKNRIVDFHKKPQHAHDWHGESVGFFRLTPQAAAALIVGATAYVNDGRRSSEYEEPLRDMILSAPAGLFGYEDITGHPWTEIDFPADVARARASILPRLAEIAAMERVR